MLDYSLLYCNFLQTTLNKDAKRHNYMYSSIVCIKLNACSIIEYYSYRYRKHTVAGVASQLMLHCTQNKLEDQLGRNSCLQFARWYHSHACRIYPPPRVYYFMYIDNVERVRCYACHRVQLPITTKYCVNLKQESRPNIICYKPFPGTAILVV